MLKQILNNYKKSYKFFVPFESLIEDGIILNKNSGFQSTFKVRFYDLDYMGEDEVTLINDRLNNAYKRLPDGFSVHFEVQRNKSDKYPTKNLKGKPYPTQIIDKIREKSVTKDVFYSTEYYITLTYIMSNDNSEKITKLLDKLSNLFMKNKVKEDSKEELLKIYKNELKEYKDQVLMFIEQLKTAAISAELLKGEELLGFLYSAINMEKREKIRVPVDDTMLLDEYLTVSTLSNGEYTKINDEYVKVITINMFPDNVTQRIFNQLESLNFEYRYVTRFIMLSKEEALEMLKNFKIYFSAKVKTLAQWMLEVKNGTEVQNIDTVALDKVDEADFALNEAKTGVVAYGYYTFSFIIKDKDLEILDKKINEVRRILNFYDFVAGVDKYNTLDSIFGSLPGNIVNNVRKAPMNTYLLSALLPMSSLYTGNKINNHLKDVALFTTKTEKELFYLNLHNKDIGHSLIIGPTGAGKSFLLSMIAANFLKYEGKVLDEYGSSKIKPAQVFFFDKDASSRVLTYTSGGKFYDLGKKEIAFQPLKNIHIKSEREWALGWIINILEQERVSYDATTRNIVEKALDSLSIAKVESRTLSNLRTYIASSSKTIASVLDSYCGNNVYGEYFDNNFDNISNNNFITFEMGDVISKPKVISPLLDYIFHKIETEKLDGTPTVILLDECWIFLKNEKMRDKINEWLKVLRKKNTSVIFATQSLSEIADSPIFSAIVDACKTNIFLPNEKAMSTWLNLYKKFNLTEKEIQEINNAVMKQDYFVKTTEGSRLFQLNPTDIEIAYLGASTNNDQNTIISLKNKIDNEILSGRDKILNLNKEWINYKYKIGEVSLNSINQIKEILNEKEKNK
ncbi:transporter [Streptobacillus moniliformis]|uniref:CagE TrbE VirB component of type IV transporter system n=1 Tax=Streptobacillus moniliformis (strain ATCC 14647 / DSM 12112 / NCTC 10651 / 9901) TaxID=519441 RepID=D1AV72_STRM9|nr:transporter [Streptobacillus moniliformis]ACZ01632.1 CagE TrbE VirB component of type IV transporter system [Streptobacillus moniliformis DSM 12112]AVL43366.1 transporter [Streptobacillus moniliformis]SQA13189.1 Type IV secretion system protein virB4 [Streptobacillus moniliformis]